MAWREPPPRPEPKWPHTGRASDDLAKLRELAGRASAAANSGTSLRVNRDEYSFLINIHEMDWLRFDKEALQTLAPHLVGHRLEVVVDPSSD